MTNVNHHIIRTQEYQIQLEDEKGAYAFQTKVSQLQSGVINDLLDRILTSYSEKGFLIQFNEIILDLGTISKLNWEKEIEHRIEEQLSRFLQSAIRDSGSLRTGKKIKIIQHDIEMLEHFLLHGYVSWNHPVHTRPASLFTQLITQQDKALRGLLKNIGKKESVRKRLISQFDDTILDKTVVAVTDNQQQYLVRFRQHISSYQKENKLIDTSEGNFRNVLWEIILAFVFTETTGYYNKKFFVKYTLQRIALKYRFGYSDLLNTIYEAISLKRKEIYTDIEFEKVFLELYQEDTAVKEILSSESTTESRENIHPNEFERLLRYFLEHESLPYYAGIHTMHELFLLIKNQCTRSLNISESHAALLLQIYERLKPSPAISGIAGWEEVFRKISGVENTKRLASESYLKSVFGADALARFIYTLETCVNQQMRSSEIRFLLFQEITQKALQISVDANVLLRHLLGYLTTQIQNKVEQSFSRDLIYYVTSLHSVNIDHSTNQQASQTIDEAFMQVPINQLLLRLHTAMVANQNNGKINRLADQIFMEYAARHAINRALLAQQVRIVLLKEHKRFNAGMLQSELLIYLDERSRKETHNLNHFSLNYSVDLLEYYAAYHQIPGWANGIEVKALSIHIERLAKKSPKTLRKLIAEDGAALLDIVPHADYIRMLHVLDATDALPDFIFRIQILIEECINQKMVQVWPETKKLRRFFRRFFSDQILQDASILKDKKQLLDVCIQELKKYLPLRKEEILALLVEQKKMSHTNDTVAYDSHELNLYLESIAAQVLTHSGAAEANTSNAETEVLISILAAMEVDASSQLPDRSEIFMQLVNYSRISPGLFLEHLRQLPVRRLLVQKISSRMFLQLIYMHTDDAAKKNIQASMGLFVRIRKYLTSTQTTQFWKEYAEALLLKLSVDGNRGLREREIAWMFYKCMTQGIQRTKAIDILHKLNAQTSVVSFRAQELRLFKRIQSGVEKSAKSITKKSLLHKTSEIKRQRTEEDLIGESVFLNGSGVVILTPFIPVLFTKANLVSDSVFISQASSAKAIQLLHYAVFGNVQVDESDTFLFKLICGMDPEAPLEIETALLDTDRQLVDGLLQAVIQQWSILKNTSVQGLRETFLMREGKLQIEEEQYLLQVEPKTFDMLLDHIPWGISKIKFSWMKKMISVQWR